ncbi:MAG: class II glutamine amidotransferase [Polyangiales bacterium]
MSRLLVYLANRMDSLAPVLAQEQSSLALSVPEAPVAWGLGCYHGNEVLHKKQPSTLRRPLSLDALAAGIRADCVVLQVEALPDDGFRMDDTPPFRFRRWLMGHTGPLSLHAEARHAIEQDLPSHLNLARRGDSDGERFFALLLHALQAEGALEPRRPDHEAVVQGISAACRRLDAVAGQVMSQSFVLTRGDATYVVQREAPVIWRTGRGLRQHEDEEDARASTAPPSLLRYFLFSDHAGSPPPGYQPVGPARVAILDRSLQLSFLPLLR